MPMEELKFDAKTVRLSGTNLIEASAGTGKTYSIAILVLRILLEKTVDEKDKERNISIKEILMVTFTKAAVAELEERVRQFVRNAYRVSQGLGCEDQTIMDIVQSAIHVQGKSEVDRKLKEAVEFLDETSVLTIHSFCQQILREFAFETRQSFSVELIADLSDVFRQQINQFWRSQITVMPVDMLSYFGKKLSRKNLGEVVNDFFNGKPILNYTQGEQYILNDAYWEMCRSESAHLNGQIDLLKQQMLDFCINEHAFLLNAVDKNTHSRNAFAGIINNPELFLSAFLKKLDNPPGYIKNNFGQLFELAESFNRLSRERDDMAERQLLFIYAAAIYDIAPAVNAYKEKHGQLSFDDLIDQLHNRLYVEHNDELVVAIQKKFKVVFIDEFQDTDRKQYDIFNSAFGRNTVVFYIGDPKQSIYAWRKADIATYLMAASQVDNKYGMHINYRSSDDFIDAMNSFFMPHQNFDTFYYQNSPTGIYYHQVSPPAENKKANLLYKNDRFPVINIVEANNAKLVQAALVAQVAALLAGDYEIVEAHRNENGNRVLKRRSVRPNDIGILVRANNDAIPFKNDLAKLGIPSVVIGLSKILGSEEAKNVLYVLEAILNPTRNTINRALLTSFTGLNLHEMMNQDEVMTIGRFSSYKLEWEKDGVYKALFSFIADYKVETYLTDSLTRGGERIISNLYQIIELLYKQQISKNLSAIELIDWLRRGIENPREDGDEYEQRVESDDLCVTIMTIHKSKGLQFNIVLTDALDMNVSLDKKQFIELKNESGENFILPINMALEENKAEYTQQQLQENRRMIYVSLTRAVYGCFIYSSISVNKKATSAIHDFLTAFKDMLPPGIDFTEPLAISKGFRYKRQSDGFDKRAVPANNEVYFNLIENDWRKLSYTYLAASGFHHNKFEGSIFENEYDQFVFEDLKRGNITGNLLHDIFEHISFEQPAFWSEVVDKAVNRYAPHVAGLYKKNLIHLLQHVSEASIITDQGSFSLREMDAHRRLNEFEFDFPVRYFEREALSGFLGERARLQVARGSGWEGMMNGKIDMFFEFGGKYYLLDWKSTYLGSSLTDYNKESLDIQMSMHNYDLQYLIYTVATVKYLEQQLVDFNYERDFGGVLYYFLRGIRKGETTGVFYTRPDKKLVYELINLFTGANT
ncbi:DNA helicase/exodeoxyribonuclease V, beta subunit [Arachidicoccus rhizosphaerae]|uniref:RecBCD enzyme subunit RecB n=1 Tax=Arachidicoccus rhizosphaerae TaxID=551991 RepID=A0A1H3YXN2_9BACT|nr:UvrD-helicase domain-containing protein [Arachidicoccus rhizosphaerae]SEA16259.1 DNA helicase/exodeoxyribonuclease V, beta subunit [Arachidicoccus rhizosphaerae]